jgi:hypothetical protein
MTKTYKHKIIIKRWFTTITVESDDSLEEIKEFIKRNI